MRNSQIQILPTSRTDAGEVGGNAGFYFKQMSFEVVFTLVHRIARRWHGEY
jgi:hypothetical protein